MENNRSVTRAAIWLYAILGLAAALAAILAGRIVPLSAWFLVPAACVVVVLLQFAVAGPLMLLTAWLAGGRTRGSGEDRDADNGA